MEYVSSEIVLPCRARRESKQSLIKSYQVNQQLKHHGFPKIWFTNSGLVNNRIYAKIIKHGSEDFICV